MISSLVGAIYSMWVLLAWNMFHCSTLGTGRHIYSPDSLRLLKQGRDLCLSEALDIDKATI